MSQDRKQTADRKTKTVAKTKTNTTALKTKTACKQPGDILRPRPKDNNSGSVCTLVT